MGRLTEQSHDKFETEMAELRRQNDEQDRILKVNAERERLGLPTLEEEARQKEIEARNAATRDRQRQYFEGGQQNQDDIRIQLQVRDAALAFMANSDYHRSPRNFELLTTFIDANGLDATNEQSFHIAYGALKNQMERPSRHESTPVAQPQRVVEELPPGAERAPSGRVYSAAEIEEMSAEQYADIFRLHRGHNYRIVKSPLGLASVEDRNSIIGQPR